MSIRRVLLRIFVIGVCIAFAAPVRLVPRQSLRGPTAAAMQAASQVRVDSLVYMLQFLSVDPATGQPRSRFTFREEELSEVADSLASRLQRYTSYPPERTSFIVSDEYYDPGSFTTENIIARVPGAVNDSSAVIICAHYDAIGSRTDGWRENWETMPAPGADDNGTGVAALLEAARILPAYELPFDLLFVLFSGEELGKLGSIDFVNRCDSVCAGRILGVFNLDMIGYNEDGKVGGSILTNYSSGWMADMLIEVLPAIDPYLPLRIVKPGPSNWDHASFWEHAWKEQSQPISAVTLAEPLQGGGFVIYPYYHSVSDTIGWIDLEQMERITKVLVGFVAGFTGLPPEIAVLPSDLLIRGEENFFGAKSFPAGETITASVRCRNIGGEAPPVQTAVFLDVTLENAGGLRTLYAGPVEAPGPLRASETVIPFSVSTRDAGENWMRARISVSGFDDGEANNETLLRFFVQQEGVDILAGYHFRPNPISGSFSNADFCVNLAGEANILVDIFTMEGERIGTAHIGPGYGRALNIGNNCFSCRELFPGITDLASGIYLYRLNVQGTSGGAHQHTGQFAVLN